MKKSLLALSALAACGGAQAQSSVTLFGVIDASISHYASSGRTNVTTSPITGLPTAVTVVPSRSQTVLGNGNNASSRFGFRGTEDLGGGYAASFWLESPVGNDSGSIESNPVSFTRRSTVSLSGPFGELRLGRDYTPTYRNNATFDPFGTVGVGTSAVQQANGPAAYRTGVLGADANSTRASNSVAYFLPPSLGGFYGQVMYAFHENVKQQAPVAGTAALTDVGSRKGRYVGGWFGYASGPLNVAASYGESTLGNFSGTLLTGTATAVTAAGIRGAYDAKVKTANIGASWDFDVVKIVGELSKRKTEFEQPAAVPAVSDSADQKGFLVGALVPVGAGQLKFSYSRVKTTLPNTIGVIGRISYPVDTPDPTVSKLAIGYVHNLSKRTALYATVARVSNRNMAAQTISPANQSVTMFTGAPNAKGTGYDFGVRHTF